MPISHVHDVSFAFLKDRQFLRTGIYVNRAAGGHKPAKEGLSFSSAFPTHNSVSLSLIPYDEPLLSERLARKCTMYTTCTLFTAALRAARSLHRMRNQPLPPS